MSPFEEPKSCCRWPQVRAVNILGVSWRVDFGCYRWAYGIKLGYIHLLLPPCRFALDSRVDGLFLAVNRAIII